MLSASEISKMIREKKRKMADSIGLVDANGPDMDAQGILDKDQDGYVESVLDSEPRIAAEAMTDGATQTVDEIKGKRMARLRAYLDGMKLDGA